jgi:hypothetical protein
MRDDEELPAHFYNLENGRVILIRFSPQKCSRFLFKCIIVLI